MSFSGRSNIPWQRNVMQGRVQSSDFLQDTQMLMRNAQQNNMVAFSNGGMQHGGNAKVYSGRGGIGTVTKIGNNCGLIDDEVFFYRNVCKGDVPVLGDRVMYQASVTNNGQFKWDATSVELLKQHQQLQLLMGSSKESYSSVVPLNDYRSQMGNNSPIRSIHERDPRRGICERMRRSRERDEDDYEHKRKCKDHENSRDRLALVDSRSSSAVNEEHGNDDKERESARNKELQVAECGMLYTRRYRVQVPDSLLWQTSHMPPVSNCREQTTTMESSLSLVVHNVTNLQKNEICKKDEVKEKEKNLPRGGFMQPTSLPTGKSSDSVSILVNQNKDESYKMVNGVSESVGNYSKPKKKRLSGAQRKKLKKMRQLNILDQLRAYPKEKSNLPSSSVDDGKWIRTPNKQDSKGTFTSVVNNAPNEGKDLLRGEGCNSAFYNSNIAAKGLSRSQRKKLKKMRLQNVLEQPRESPKYKYDFPSTSVDGANRIRSLEEQDTERAFKNKKSSSPTSKPEIFWQMSRQNSTSRVDSEKIGTPANSNLLVRAPAKNLQSIWKKMIDVDKDKVPPSNAEMARKKRRFDLCYEIYDAGNRTGRFPVGRQSMIEDLINNKIVDHAIVTKGQQPIEIVKSEFKNGVMVMKLATQQCARTLQALVESIPPPWNGAKLKLMKMREPVKLTKTTLYIKGWGSKFTNERILEILGSQNTNLAVEKFMVFHRKELSEGTLLVIGIDQISMASLVKNKGRAFFASNTVRFRIGKVPIEEAVTEGPSKEIKAVARIPAVKKCLGSQTACEEVVKSINKSHGDSLLGCHY